MRTLVATLALSLAACSTGASSPGAPPPGASSSVAEPQPSSVGSTQVNTGREAGLLVYAP